MCILTPKVSPMGSSRRRQMARFSYFTRKHATFVPRSRLNKRLGQRRLWSRGMRPANSSTVENACDIPRIPQFRAVTMHLG